MAVTVKASLGKTKYYTEVTAGENQIITDEPSIKADRIKASILGNSCHISCKLYSSNFENVY
jgi:hypothetical protein